ncbi:hypothetical protein CVT25_006606 [Psilocybe cyanescens]|uniref:Histone H1 n=1 Tax=Psilocybe cyanescens TaxID=93625 RepID=A0A409XKK0_PSICY|nr:hypothetical protein CVT25_006606 [Psilocybe cyanescens]
MKWLLWIPLQSHLAPYAFTHKVLYSVLHICTPLTPHPKPQADVEMADVTKPGPSIQFLIDKGLNARLKKLNLTSSGQNSSKAPQPKASGSKPKSSNPLSNSKPATKANVKVDNKKKGKGKAPIKVDHKGKGKAKA